jgi:hypothetical protein
VSEYPTLLSVGKLDTTVSAMTAAADLALDALRRWAATNRADLVAAAWHAGNRNITALANAAGRGRDVIYADLRSRGIDPKTDRTENPPVTTTPTLAPGWTDYDVPGWRHPNLLWVQARVQADGDYAGRVSEWKFGTKPFTGTEPQPEVPEEWRTVHPTDSDLLEGDYGRWAKYNQRNQEIRLVQGVWARARFTLLIGQLLKKPHQYDGRTAAQFWTDYVAARDKLTSAYAALATTPDNMWRAATLNIVDAKKPAEDAAIRWDETAQLLAEQNEWLRRELGDDNYPSDAIAVAAKEHGIDVDGWLIGWPSDYTGSWSRSPACEQIHQVIETGDERVKTVELMIKGD